MLALDTFRTMAHYNRWMNERLYAVCAEIPDGERRRDRGAFFKSIHGTLNHLLLGDRLWMGRFLDRPFTVDSLDQELLHQIRHRHGNIRLPSKLGGQSNVFAG